MNLWSSPDRFQAIRETAAVRSQAEDLITEIAAALSASGRYVARIDLQPTQGIVDFNWAARQAGRRLGVRVDVNSRIIKADGQVEVRVRTVSARA